MAITRASLENIPVNLVTSIPSIETYNNIVNRKYHITKLEKISIFLSGYIFFNSEKILSTPGPQNNKSHFFLSLQVLNN